jgi:hypothetical protein
MNLLYYRLSIGTYYKNMAIRIFKFFFFECGEFGSFFSWKILCIGQNHIFQVKILPKSCPPKKTMVIQNCITSFPSLMLHMPVVINALSTRIMLQFFPPVCPLPHFFHSRISRLVLGPCHTCFGHVPGVRGKYIMLQDPWQRLSGMLSAPWYS